MKDSLQELQNVENASGWARFRTYAKLSGPGWLQSAITLGGGSLAGALFLGVVGGYSVLWVQAGAIILGVIMLAAIGYVTLSTGESPFQSMRTRINPVLAWGWILAALAANMVFVLPQYSLAFGALTENIFPGLAEMGDSFGFKLLISCLILGLVMAVTFLYGSGGRGIRIYENILKTMVGLIVVAFILVVVRLALSEEGLPFGQILAGFIPSPGLIFHPSEAYQQVLQTIENAEVRTFWTELVVSRQRTVMIAAASAAVGINMTFMLPYTMRAKGWGKQHRGLAIFDLSTGMVIPFIIATSCIVIASGNMFNGKPYQGILETHDGVLQISANPAYTAQVGELEGMLTRRPGGYTEETKVEPGELELAAMLLHRSNRQFARSLEVLVGPTVAHLIFGIGVLGMALSTISVLMLISGAVVCEVFKVPHGGIHFKMGTLLAATGVLWPILWTGSSKAYLAIPAAALAYTLLPVALLAFFLMINSRQLLGENMPRGRHRFVWNALLGLVLLITGSASLATSWGKSMTIGGAVVPVGRIFIIGYLVAVILGHFYMKAKSRNN
ncbi:MAG: divalent metal cation transporter [Puniceicoccaceae bacterium]